MSPSSGVEFGRSDHNSRDFSNTVDQVALSSAHGADAMAAAQEGLADQKRRLATIANISGGLRLTQLKIAAAIGEMRARTIRSNVSLGTIASNLKTLMPDVKISVASLRALIEQGGDLTGRAVHALDSSINRMRELSTDAKNAAINLRLAAARMPEAKDIAVLADLVSEISRGLWSVAHSVGERHQELSGKLDSWLQSGKAAMGGADQSVGEMDPHIRHLVAEYEAASTSETTAEAMSALFMQTDAVSGSLEELIRDAEQALESLRAVLDEAHGHALACEDAGRSLFEQVGREVLGDRDRHFVEQAVGWRDRLEAAVATALADGTLAVDALFDADYRPIVDTSPERFRTRLTDWADTIWRPLLDAAADETGAVAAARDRNGFLPTHMTRFSQELTGDYHRDVALCRNGRRDAGPAAMLGGTEAYNLSIGRDLDGDGRMQLVKLVRVPLVFDGRAWGTFELTYRP